MDFLEFLTDYEKVDTSVVKQIIEKRDNREELIISEAFNTEYPSKKLALFTVENILSDSKTAPAGVDVKYVKSHMDRLKTKIANLTEGDIRIIIHNHEDSKGSGESLGFDEENGKPKRGRGRPKGSVNKSKGAVEMPTAVIYDDVDDENVQGDDDMKSAMSKLDIPSLNDAFPIDEEEEEDVVADVSIGSEELLDGIADQKIEDDELEKKKTKADVKSPSKTSWSDVEEGIEDIEDDELSDEDTSLLDELAKLDLTDEQLTKASGKKELDEDGIITKARSLIDMISSI